ncbi:MAG TPA: hypothetical protein DEB31_08970, partial [Clostridiales bacterium]|nr:hypothetical protein [Clostridiales bacterium]
MPQTYDDIAQGKISPETITAPYDFVDKAGTQRKIDAAVAAVEDIYVKSDERTNDSIQKLSEDFAAFERARAFGESVFTDTEEAKRQAAQDEIDEEQRRQEEAARASASASAA